jgi:hypothetical protein
VVSQRTAHFCALFKDGVYPLRSPRLLWRLRGLTADCTFQCQFLEVYIFIALPSHATAALWSHSGLHISVPIFENDRLSLRSPCILWRLCTCGLTAGRSLQRWHRGPKKQACTWPAQSRLSKSLQNVVHRPKTCAHPPARSSRLLCHTLRPSYMIDNQCPDMQAELGSEKGSPKAVAASF